MKRLSAAFFTALLAGSSLSGCAYQNAEQTVTAAETGRDENMTVLTIGTADNGGTMCPVGRALADVISSHDPSIKVNISASTGSAYNAEQILNGQFDMGLVSGDVVYETYFSSESQAQQYVQEPSKYDLAAIGAVYVSVSHWMAPQTSGLFYVHDLQGKRASIGLNGSNTEASARLVLDAVGVKESELALFLEGYYTGMKQVQNEKRDVVHGLAGIPIPSMLELANEMPIRLLRYTEEELQNILEQNPYYYRTEIPAGTYPGQKKAVQTFGVKCLLCVRNDMDRDLVYRITETLDQSVNELAEKHSSMAAMQEVGFVNENLPIPLHPGARAYYQEKK